MDSLIDSTLSAWCADFRIHHIDFGIHLYTVMVMGLNIAKSIRVGSLKQGPHKAREVSDHFK